MKTTQSRLDELFKKHGYEDYRWMSTQGIVVSHWVRMKCRFGCNEYGRNASCPPNVPTVSECERFFREYSLAAAFHFAKKVDRPEDRHAWTRDLNRKLLQLEREVFCAGYHQAFLLFMDSCGLCESCVGVREKCIEPKMARPTPEALAVDVFATVRRLEYPIEVLSDYSQEMNRYAFLLVE